MSSGGISVIRLADDYPINGVPTYGLQPNFVYLSSEQAKMGLRVTVVARRHGRQPVLEDNGGVTVMRVDSPYSLNSLALVKRLVKERQGALIHTHSTTGVATVAFKRNLGVPIFAHVHGTSRSAFMPVQLTFMGFTQGFSQSRLWYYYFRERFLWSRATKVLAVSRAVKSDLSLCYRIPASRVNVVYNGVDPEVFRPMETSEPLGALAAFRDRPIVLYVGHFGPRKGIGRLIEAMKDVKKQVPDAALVCIGGVPDWLPRTDYWARLRDFVRVCGLEGSVALLDKVPNSQLPMYYSRASVFVLPSYYEAFAKVIIEAMACATPVVTTFEGGPSEVVSDGVNGSLYHYGDLKQLARAIVALLSDRAAGKKDGVGGQGHYRKGLHLAQSRRAGAARRMRHPSGGPHQFAETRTAS